MSVTVQPTRPQPTPAKAAAPRPALSSTVDQANRSFVSQWGPTPWNSGGHPYGFEDCVPTSAVMAASALGLIAHPAPAGAEDAIDHMRDLSLGYDSKTSNPMSFTAVAKGLRQQGAITQGISATTPAVDAALAQGKPVIVCGDPWKAWGASMSANGQYLNHRDPGNHACVILGKTADGKYLLADPLSKVGTVPVSAEQLRSFWANGYPGAMAVSRADGKNPSPMPTPTPAPTPAPTPSNGAPPAGLRRGDLGGDVDRLQRALVKLGYLSERDRATGPGTFGPHTEAAVTAFQRANGISPTGYYGDQTRAALDRALRAPAPKPSPAPSPKPAPAPAPKISTAPQQKLRQGDRGANVDLLQRDLVRLGFLRESDRLTGPGIFGPHTLAAVRAFQASQGVPATGFYGDLTRAALERALAR